HVGRDDGVRDRCAGDDGLLLLPEQALLNVPPLGEIVQRHQEEPVLAGTERTAVDFHGELAAVTSPGEDPGRSTLRRDPRRFAIAHAEGVVHLLEALGDEPTGRLATELYIGPPQEPLGLAIERHRAALLVDDDHGIGRGVEHLPKSLVPRAGRAHRCVNSANLGCHTPRCAQFYSLWAGSQEKTPQAGRDTQGPDWAPPP